MEKLKRYKGITLIALVITIIILLILAGITISSLTNSGLFDRVKEAKEKWKNAQNEEEIQLAKYSNEIDSYVGGDRAVTDEEIENKIKNVLDKYYQKLKSYNSEDVSFTNGTTFIAPCDGYYCYQSSVGNTTANIDADITLYNANNVKIGYYPAGAYTWGTNGDEIYMRKGEYISFFKRRRCINFIQ